MAGASSTCCTISPVRFLKGTFRLRQVTRLTAETGHQTAILTSRWDLRPVMVAYRMFERWRQENFFKYMREEFLIDTLTDYQVEPDDPNRLVPNPARKVADQHVRKARRRSRPAARSLRRDGHRLSRGPNANPARVHPGRETDSP